MDRVAHPKETVVVVLSATFPAASLVVVASPHINPVPLLTLAMIPLAAAGEQTTMLTPLHAAQHWAIPVRRPLTAASLGTLAGAMVNAVGALARGATQTIVIRTKIVAMTCCVGPPEVLMECAVGKGARPVPMAVNVAVMYV